MAQHCRHSMWHVWRPFLLQHILLRIPLQVLRIKYTPLSLPNVWQYTLSNISCIAVCTRMCSVANRRTPYSTVTCYLYINFFLGNLLNASQLCLSEPINCREEYNWIKKLVPLKFRHGNWRDGPIASTKLIIFIHLAHFGKASVYICIETLGWSLMAAQINAIR